MTKTAQRPAPSPPPTRKPRPPPKPKAPTLAEQKTDFTAEGSPPPGKVSTAVPETVADDGQPSGAGTP